MMRLHMGKHYFTFTYYFVFNLLIYLIQEINPTNYFEEKYYQIWKKLAQKFESFIVDIFPQPKPTTKMLA